MDDIGAIQLTIKAEFKELTGLLKTTDQTKRAVKLLAKDFSRTKDLSKYMSGINQIVTANKALGNSAGMSRSQIMKLGVKVQQETKFTDALTVATKRLTTAQKTSNKVLGNTRNKMNGNNMAIQQLGYQFGDFAVQVQGGTSAFVAFSQQGSQLAGILPMIAGPLGLSMGAAVGLSAALGILIPVGSAVARMFFEMSGTAEKSAKSIDDFVSSLSFIKSSADIGRKSIRDLRQEFGVMAETVKELQGYLQQVSVESALTAMSKAVNPFSVSLAQAATDVSDFKATIDQLKADLSSGGDAFMTKALITEQEEGLAKLQERFKVAPEMLSQLQTALTDVQKAVGLEDIRDKSADALKFLEGLRDTSTEISPELNAIALELEKVFTASSRATAQLDGFSTSGLSSASDQADGLRARFEQLGKSATIWSRSMSKGYKIAQDSASELAKISQELRDSTSLQLIKNQLVDTELKYGKDSNVYKNELIKLEKFQLEVEQKITKEKLLTKGVDEASIDLMQFQQTEALKLLQIRRDIANTPLTYSMMEGSDAAQRLGKYGGRGTTSDKDPTMGGVSIYKEPKQTQEQKDAEALGKYIDQLRHEKNVETELVGLFGSEREIKQKILDIQKEYDGIITPLQVKQIENTLKLTDAETKRHEALQKAKEEQEALGASIEASMEKAFMSMVDGTASVKDAFKTMAREIIAELYRVLVVKKMVASISTAFGFADGGVFSSGSQVQAYADGGVVGSPTTFPMSGGKTGLMGEAGPEAIMPLKRGANGKLGVQMEGGGATTVVQNFNFSANGDDSVKRIIAQAAPKIAQMTKSEILNDRRRGGTMKATFG